MNSYPRISYAQKLIDLAKPKTIKQAYKLLKKAGFYMINSDTFYGYTDEGTYYCSLSPDPLAPAGITVDVLLRHEVPCQRA